MPDILQVLKSTKLDLVRTRDEGDDVRSFYFQPRKNFRHRAGQHGLFTLPDGAGTHPFTLANAPAEDHVILGTRIGTGSRYKQRLARLQVGETISMRGPMFDFVLDPDLGHAVMLAQGIGITPFRSMFVDVDSRKAPVTTHLVHVAPGQHTYRELTESLAGDATYATGSEQFTSAATTAAHDLGTQAAYYLSGSPDFVKGTTALLTAAGIPARNIKNDTFTGYTSHSVHSSDTISPAA